LGVGVGIAEIILAMRTWVIWSRDRRVALGLGLLLVLLWIPVFFFLNEALSSLVFTVPPKLNTPGCFLASQKNILYVVFILIMIFETVILTLTLIKGLEHFKKASSPLVTVLYRDGMLNYVYLFILSIINLAVITSAPHGYTTLLTAMQRVVHSILSGRILLHLRQAASTKVITSRMDHMSGGISAVSAGWQFKKRAQENRSFIDTIREDFRDDTVTWFGTEAVETSTGSGTLGTRSLSTNDTEMLNYTYTSRGVKSAQDDFEIEEGGRVRVVNPTHAAGSFNDEESHLDLK